MRESYIPVTVYPPEGDRFIECAKCKNPCVVGVEEIRGVCLMCLMGGLSEGLFGEKDS